MHACTTGMYYTFSAVQWPSLRIACHSFYHGGIIEKLQIVDGILLVGRPSLGKAISS
jgi:hypothetical protein